ncbi:MAG: conjugal transfer protein TraH [Candidatus Omnitrophica bacterium]|nr:conjugal transfer protein TraH [Candidatus Omnitrophota bacterium]
MKNLMLVLSLVFIFSSFSFADIWQNQGIISQSTLNNDNSGFTYQAGTTFNPPYYQTPSIGYSYNVGLGCSGLNLSADFSNLLNAQALTNYAESIGENALAASPMVLLEMASPTLADTLKNLENRAQSIQLLQYKSCQNLQKMGMNLAQQMRGQSEYNQLQQSGNLGNIDTIVQNKNLQLTNYTGQPTTDLYLFKDGYQWTGAKNSTQNLSKKLIGDVEVRQNGSVGYIAPASSPNQVYDKELTNYYQKLQIDVDQYLASNQVPDLTSVSLPTFPVTPELIKSIGTLPEPTRDIAIGKLASGLALIKTTNEIDDINTNLEKMDGDPTLTNAEKGIISQKQNYLSSVKSTLINENNVQDKVATQVANGIIAKEKEEKAKNLEEINNQVQDTMEQKTFYNPFGFGGISQ